MNTWIALALKVLDHVVSDGMNTEGCPLVCMDKLNRKAGFHTVCYPLQKQEYLMGKKEMAEESKQLLCVTIHRGQRKVIN